MKDFTPKEIEIILSLGTKSCLLKSRMDESGGYRRRYKDAVMLVDENSVPILLKVSIIRLKK